MEICCTILRTSVRKLIVRFVGQHGRRVIQEYVPGKQVTLAHIICNPRSELCSLIGVDRSGARGDGMKELSKRVWSYENVHAA